MKRTFLTLSAILCGIAMACLRRSGGEPDLSLPDALRRLERLKLVDGVWIETTEEDN